MISKELSYAFLAKRILALVRLWSGGRPGRVFKLWKRYRFFMQATRRRDRLLKQENLMVPPVIILSATMECNFSCQGCYSRNYPLENELSLEEIDVVLTQAEELGVGFFVMTGGEPLLRRGITDVLLKHPKLIFLFFTNGSLVDRDWVRMVKGADHIVPLLSVEGNREETDRRRGPGTHDRVMAAMGLIKEAGILFGFSATACRDNVATLSREAFYDDMIGRGCRIGLCTVMVPSAGKAALAQVPTKEEQAILKEGVNRVRKTRPLVLIHLPDDEYEPDGVCVAAGRGFIHINAQGYAEPCPFSHIAADNIRQQPLKEILRSRLFRYIRETPGLLGEPTLGCALYEHRAELEKRMGELGARSTELPAVEAAE